jgi:two-component system sensor histidine kinase KdpD
VVAIAVVGLTTAILVGARADLTFASIVLLLAVAGNAVLGYAPGLAAAISSAALLTYYFTPPAHSLRIDEPDDILVLLAYVAVSLLVGATIARINDLRRRAAVSAREASLRVQLTQELRGGVPVASVLRHLETELDEMFELSWCRVVVVPEDGASPTGPATTS